MISTIDNIWYHLPPNELTALAAINLVIGLEWPGLMRKHRVTQDQPG